MARIKLEECPPTIINYYVAHSVRGVTTSLSKDGTQEYVIRHSKGKDHWKYEDHEWRLVKKA